MASTPCCAYKSFVRSALRKSLVQSQIARRQARHPSVLTSARLYSTSQKAQDLAFVFDIDGVLLRGRKALPSASKALATLREQRIPFLLLTNGGGFHEEKRAAFLSKELGVDIGSEEIIQSHTPFQDMHEYKSGTALIVGGEHGNACAVAKRYGFEHAITPSDIYQAEPTIWPFSRPLSFYHETHARPNDLPPLDPSNLSKSLKVDSIFVYNDPRDWGLDLALIIDLLLSHRGHVGTVSGRNGLEELPNNGYQQDGQPPLFFSNLDLWFAADFHLSRLGQGAFRAAVKGVWDEVTGGCELQHRVLGKPNQDTYEFAERRLMELNQRMGGSGPLKNVYMVGDNPESDIRGAMGFKSSTGIHWHSALVSTGVYSGGRPSVKPSTILDDVLAAVQWGTNHAKSTNE